MSNLNKMINKLDTATKATLELAINNCASQQNASVELCHWLKALFAASELEFSKIFNRLGIDCDQQIKLLNKDLQQLPANHSKTPTFSLSILKLLDVAWSLASLEFNKQKISSSMLALALFHEKSLSAQLIKHLPELSKLNFEQAKQHVMIKPELDSNNQLTVLDTYAHHLNQRALDGKIDEVIGREDEINQMIDILARRRQNNVMLVGEPGVGKTAIVEGLALRIIQDNVPALLKNVDIYALDLCLLQAGASVKGEFERRLNQLINAVKQHLRPIILFIDEAHTLMKADDAANFLKPALARGELRAIAATTWSEYKEHIESDPALTRRFQLVKVTEPSPTITIRMLRSLIPSLEEHHHVKILENALHAAANLADRYITNRQLPDKAISVLDTACARIASEQVTSPKSFEKANHELSEMRQELQRLEQEMELGINHSKSRQALSDKINQLQKSKASIHKQWQQELELVKQLLEQHHQLFDEDNIADTKKDAIKSDIKKTKKQLHKIQREIPLVKAYVDNQAIADVIADWTGVPLKKLLNDEVKQLFELEDYLKSTIIAQDKAMHQIAKAIRTSRAQLQEPNKPLGVFLFVGPSGVGKTQTAIALAERLYGKAENLITINLSEYKESHRVAQLTGAPPGYVGYGKGGILTEAVKKQPYSLVLLDEFEKAHRSLHDIFYQVFDKGHLRDGNGVDISFKNTLLIMTANLGETTIDEYANHTPEQQNYNHLIKAIYDDLTKTLAPALLGRLTIIPFLPLKNESLSHIVKLKLDAVINRIKTQHNVTLMYREDVFDALINQCQQSDFGARQIDNIINQAILPCLSDVILQSMNAKVKLNTIVLRLDHNGDFYCQSRFDYKNKKGLQHA